MSSEIKVALIRARFDELAIQRADAIIQVQEFEQSMNSLIDQLIEEGISDDEADILAETLAWH